MNYLKYILTFFFVKKRPKGIAVIVAALAIGLINIYQKEIASNLTQAKLDETIKVLYNCRAKKISDGDSFWASCEGKDINVRFSGLDAPETGQAPWGGMAKNFLSKQISNESFTVEIVETDRYQRKVARAYLEKSPRIDVGLEIIKSGNAVVYHRYNKDPLYVQAEQNAKDQKLGVWSKNGAHQNPEKWRRLNKRN